MEGYIAIYGTGNNVALYPKSSLISATVPSNNTVLLKFKGTNSAVATFGTPAMTGSGSTQSVDSIAVTNGGGFYTSVPTVTLSTGNATATAVLTNGAVTSVTIGGTNNNYSAAPTVSIGAPDFVATSARDEVEITVREGKASDFISFLAGEFGVGIKAGQRFVTTIGSITKGIY